MDGVFKTVGVVTNVVQNIGETAINLGQSTVGIVQDTVINNTVGLLNPKDLFIELGKKYILKRLMNETPRTFEDIMLDNVSYSIAQYFITPFERSRLLLQSQHIIPKIANSPYLGAVDSIFKMMRDTGFRSLFRGSVPGMMYYLYYFNINDFRQKSLILSYQKDTSKMHSFGTLSKLFLFDFANNLISYPIELIWTRRSCDTRAKVEFSHFPKEMHFLYKTQGIKSLFSGFSYSACYFISYYTLFTPFVIFHSFTGKDLLSVYIDVTFGAIILEFLLHPFDTIKRRKIMQVHESVQNEKYKTFLQTIKLIYKEEHIVGFYKGCLQRFILNLSRRIFFMVSWSYTSMIHEQFKNYL